MFKELKFYYPFSLLKKILKKFGYNIFFNYFCT